MAFVATSSGVTFVVGIVEQFKKASGEFGVSHIEEGELKDRTTAVKLRVLRARSIPDSLGQLLFPVASSICSVDLPGPHCHVVNPDVVILDDTAFFKLNVDPLLSSVRLWWIESKDPGAKLAHSSVRADSLPCNGGEGCRYSLLRAPSALSLLPRVVVEVLPVALWLLPPRWHAPFAKRRCCQVPCGSTWAFI